MCRYRRQHHHTTEPFDVEDCACSHHRMTSYRFRWTVVGLAIALSSCSSSSSTATATTVEGTLHAVGGPAPEIYRPLSGEISASRVGQGDGTGVGVGEDGRFGIQLASGEYNIVGRSPLFNGGAS